MSPSRLPFEQAPVEVIDKILERYIPDPDTGCWVWPGATRSGYGRVYHAGKLYCAHRSMYGAFKGAIPDSLVIDHLCRNTRCVNPGHLEAVTDGDNHRRGMRVALKTTCAKGHPWIPENWYLRANGTRWCRACQHERVEAHRDEINARRRAAYVPRSQRTS